MDFTKVLDWLEIRKELRFYDPNNFEQRNQARLDVLCVIQAKLFEELCEAAKDLKEDAQLEYQMDTTVIYNWIAVGKDLRACA